MGAVHRRRLRARPGLAAALQVARDQREADARDGARLRRQSRPRPMKSADIRRGEPDFERRAPVWGRRTFDRFLSDLIDAIPEGVYVTNEEREIVYWSEGAERITGYSGRRRRRQPLLRRHPGPPGRLRPQALHRCLPARGLPSPTAARARPARSSSSARTANGSRSTSRRGASRSTAASTASRCSASSRRWPGARWRA